jgi:DNA polymerase I
MAGGRLLLVDGMAVAYRAYFAIRGLATASGKPTNAVFGFIRMLAQMRDAWAPSHWAVAFDGGLSREKLALLREYKAQRPPVPESLRQQVATIEEYLDRAGVSYVRRAGEEADDVLASLAASLREQVEEILIATSDKDLYQLVGGKTKIVPVSGKGAAADAEAVRSRTGVEPRQIVEWLALVGDASDNIPGVAGIGPKWAAKLLSDYGSLAGIRAHLDEIGNARIRRALAEGQETIARNVAMVTLRADLPCPFSLERLAVRPADPGRLLPFFEELEFEAMARELRQTDLFERDAGC